MVTRRSRITAWAVGIVAVGALAVAVLVWRGSLRDTDDPMGPRPPAARAVRAARAAAAPPVPSAAVRLPAACPAPGSPSAPAPREQMLAAEFSEAADRAALIGDLLSAAVLYQQSADADATDANVAYRLGRTYEELGERDNAVREYCRLLTLSPGATEGREVRTRITTLFATADAAPRRAPAEEVAPLSTRNRTPVTPATPADSAPLARALPLPSTPTAAVGPAPPGPAPPRDTVRTTPSNARDSRIAVSDAVAAFGRAVEQRDIAALRAVYPGLSDRERRSWQRFFDTAREFRADLAVTSFDAEGSTAEVRVQGRYRYRNLALNREERLPVTFQATLTREAAGYRIATLR